VFEGQTIPEEVPQDSNGSAGIVERGVQESEAGIRALYLSLEERLGRELDTRERIVAFMPEYVSYLVNRLHKGEDGKVPYERVKGKKPTVLGIEFGEKIFWKRKLGNVKQKLNTRWEKGIFVGVSRSSHEVMVANPEGVVLAKDVMRMPFEQRWGKDCVDWVKWVPWHRYKGDVEADGDLPEEVSGGEEEEGEDREGEGEKVIFIDANPPPSNSCTQDNLL
jgi:hypothetical protein